MQCPRCQSPKTLKKGFKGGKQSYRCKDCGHRFSDKQESKDALPPLPKEGREYEQAGNTAKASVIGGGIHTLEQLIELFEVDLNIWRVKYWRGNVYSGQAKDADGNIQITSLPQVRADFERKVYDPVSFAPIQPVNVNLPPLDPPPNPIRVGSSILILPDTQHGFRRIPEGLEPFHDSAALDLGLQIAQYAQPDQIVLLGDHLDLPDWSDKFLVTPDMRDLTQAAVDALATWLGHLRLTCPKAAIHYIEGNHEKRMSKAIAANLAAAYGLKRAHDTHGIPVLSVPYLLGLKELGIQYHGGYPDGQVWLTDDLVCEHGDIAKAKAGATAQAYLARPYSTVCGHIHKRELLYFTEFGRHGPKIRFAGSPGTLARIDGGVPANSARNNWQQSVWLIHLPNKGNPAVEPIEIDEGKAFWRGQWIQSRV